MSGFSSAWLALRESADARARAPSLEQRLRAVLGAPDETRVVDLGAGSGANLRHLAPRLGGRQHWTLVDRDDELLGGIAEASAAWARALELTLEPAGTELRWAGAALDCRIALHTLDLAAALETLPLSRGALVTASALLDLVSRAWLERLAERCAASRAPCLFALSYDGRIELAPADPLDTEVAARFNAHQRRDKGFGAALGPDATATAAEAFAAHGYGLERAASDWRLGAADRTLTAALLRGWAEAAAQSAPAGAAAIAAWLERRLEANARGALRATVGHEDLLALPSTF